MNAMQRKRLGLPVYDTFYVRAYPSRTADRSKPIYESFTHAPATAKQTAVDVLKNLKGDCIVIVKSLEQGTLWSYAWINDAPNQFNNWS